MHLKIYENSKNYTAVIVRPKVSQPLSGLDNLVGVTVFGNLCLVPKTYDLNEQYVFFPSETQLSMPYLEGNNLYRDCTWNIDQTQKGYFEENGRVKAIKLKGHKSTGLLMPVKSLENAFGKDAIPFTFKDGDEFNTINIKDFGDFEICKKYIIPKKPVESKGFKAGRLIDDIVDSKQFPEHIDTDHLLKNLHKLTMYDDIAITIKLHGTSARVGYVKTKRKLTILEKIAKYFGAFVQEEHYSYVAGSRRVVKSVNFHGFEGKRHYYPDDLWTKVAEEFFAGKLNKGEVVYFEVIGRDYTGAEIQSGYTYGFTTPKLYIYRISNINEQGVEIDLPWNQVKERAKQLDIETPKELYRGALVSFLTDHVRVHSNEVDFDGALDEMGKHLFDRYMDKPSYLDPKIIEEGIVFRIEQYGKPKLFKLKAPEFLIHEGKQADKQILDVETANS